MLMYAEYTSTSQLAPLHFLSAGADQEAATSASVTGWSTTAYHQ